VNAPFPFTETQDIQLRVLNGRLEGAEHRLFIGKHIRIGHGFDHDVVLRGSGTKGASLELHLGEDAALIHVKSGSVTLLGRPVSAGEEAILPLYVPVRVGDYGFAIGHGEDVDRWAEAERLLNSAPANLTPRAIPLDDAGANNAAVLAQGSSPDAHMPRAGWLERLGTRFYAPDAKEQVVRHWPMLAIGTAILLIIAIVAGPFYSLANNQFKGPDAVRANMNAAGYKMLRIKTDKTSGRLLIQGVLPNDTALGKFRQFASAKLDNPLIDVKTMDSIAAAATDILVSQNVDAEAKPVRNQSLLIQSQYLPGDRQAELIAQIKRELPDVRAVTFQSFAERGDDALQYFFSTGDHGTATFVEGSEGDRGHISTTKSGKWFPGATLPTGHRLLSIEGGIARFERDGQIEELIF
jgi:type III secretion protein D